MDTKVIVEKALRGEDYSVDTKDFTDEQKATLNIEISKAAKVEADAQLARNIALKKDKERIDESKKGEEQGIFEKFKSEQFEKAKSKFLSDPRFTFKDEQTKEKVLAEFSKVASGSVDSELIFNDLKRAYSLVHSDELLSSREKAFQFEKGAADLIASGAKANGGAGGGDPEKYSQAARTLFLDWQKAGFKGKTLDDAEKLVSQGTKWRDREGLSA